MNTNRLDVLQEVKVPVLRCGQPIAAVNASLRLYLAVASAKCQCVLSDVRFVIDEQLTSTIIPLLVLSSGRMCVRARTLYATQISACIQALFASDVLARQSLLLQRNSSVKHSLSAKPGRLRCKAALPAMQQHF